MTIKVLCSLYQKAHYAMSAIYFPSPAMENVRGGEIFSRRFRSDSARRSRSTFMERVAASLFAHATVGVLSQNILM